MAVEHAVHDIRLLITEKALVLPNRIEKHDHESQQGQNRSRDRLPRLFATGYAELEYLAETVNLSRFA